MKIFGRTDNGLVRQKNEDRLLIKELPSETTLLAVFDGLGGQPGGAEAAQLAKDTLQSFIPRPGSVPRQLAALLIHTNEIILNEAKKHTELEYMGTTVTAALIQDNTVSWGHVGDCRLYHYRDSKLHQITTDQNMAQFMVEEGQMTLEEARTSPMQRMLDQCVGSPDCEPATGSFTVEAGDLLLLCTDGIHDELDPEEIAAAFGTPQTLPDRVAALIQKALAKGGNDNITVIAAQI